MLIAAININKVEKKQINSISVFGIDFDNKGNLKRSKKYVSGLIFAINSASLIKEVLSYNIGVKKKKICISEFVILVKSLKKTVNVESMRLIEKVNIKSIDVEKKRKRYDKSAPDKYIFKITNSIDIPRNSA